MPLAVVSLGQATRIWTRHALADRPERPKASRPDMINLDFILFCFFPPGLPLPTRRQPISWRQDAVPGYVDYQTVRAGCPRISFQNACHKIRTASVFFRIAGLLARVSS